MSTAPTEPISPGRRGESAVAPTAGSGPGHETSRRPALDGMRALAVAAVAIYHFGGGAGSWLPGGFLGVDVFFVLSGYLITSLLLTEYERRGRIDLLGFWVRRLRRLTPALLAMLLVVVGWIWFMSQPDGYPQRRSDIFWTVGYLANWHLINSSETYFAAYGSASPLRHAWSLAIEEQFYLVWPTLLLVLLWSGRRLLGSRGIVLPGLGRIGGGRLLLVAGALIGTGLSAAWLAVEFDPLYPSRAYYSTQGRVQELFVGVLLAIALPRLRHLVRGAGQVGRDGRAERAERDGRDGRDGRAERAGASGRPSTRGGSGRGFSSQVGGPGRVRGLTGAAVLGLVVLLVAVFRLPDDTGLYYRGGALVVCLAVAALIAGLELVPDGPLARAFSVGPAVALGRISYGVYLWHWPLVVAIGVDAGMAMREQVVRQILRVVLTLAFAVTSYHLLEQPILRSRRLFRPPARVIAAAVAASALVIGVTFPATALPGTLAEQLRQSSDTPCPGERNDRLLTCIWPAAGASAGSADAAVPSAGAAVSSDADASAAPDADADASVTPDASAAPDADASADAGHTNPAANPVQLALLGDSTGRALGPGLNDWAQRTGNSWLGAAWKLCTASGKLILPTVDGEPDQPALACHQQAPGLISTALQRYRPPVVLVAEYWAHNRTLLVDGQRLRAGTPEHDAALASGFTALVDQVAEYGGRVVLLELPPPGEQLGEAVASGRPAGHARPPVFGNGQFVDGFNDMLRSVAAARPKSARTVSIADLVCPGGNCYPVQGNMLVRNDGVHYTVPFSRYLTPLLLQRAGIPS